MVCCCLPGRAVALSVVAAVASYLPMRRIIHGDSLPSSEVSGEWSTPLRGDAFGLHRGDFLVFSLTLPARCGR